MSQDKSNVDSSDIRPIQFSEYLKARDVLVEAFSTDDSSAYLVDCDGRTPEEAHALDCDIFEYVVYAHLLNGLVLVSGDFEAVSCWMAPGKNMDDWWTILRSGMWRLYFKYGSEGRRRFFKEFLPMVRAAKARVLKENDNNSWYLVYIGTIPAGRGKGHCRKHMEYIAKIADENGQYCYLESTSPMNTVIYKKFGFEYKDTVYLNADGSYKSGPIPFELMVREPRKRAEQKDSEAAVSGAQG